ncbi:hypothetical protein ACH4OX_36405 [Streptomyces roseolus]|uniref:hypothetical protein n=1 Tax=Streptomyces roseolus TaxID=67358 RepID=UPI0037A38252
MQQRFASGRWHPDDPELRFAESLARTHRTEASVRAAHRTATAGRLSCSSTTRLGAPPRARLCAAIADRIAFRCTLIQTGTDSYRYQTTQESLFPTAE